MWAFKGGFLKFLQFYAVYEFASSNIVEANFQLIFGIEKYQEKVVEKIVFIISLKFELLWERCICLRIRFRCPEMRNQY